MAQISLAKALKVKNSLAGEVARLKARFASSNRFPKEDEQKAKAKAAAVWQEFIDKKEKLAELKGKIAVANIGIYPFLAEMEEAKDFLGYFQTVQTNRDPQIISYSPVLVQKEFEVFLDEDAVESKVKEVQALIETLQDKIDAYNHITKIDFSV